MTIGSAMKASIIIRTYNESLHLPALLDAVSSQRVDFGHEVLIVDSGSTDGTVEIATDRGCRILTINKEDFSFGRSLNLGCDAAKGSALVFISGHCIPAHEQWLARLIAPLDQPSIAYTYGRQLGDHRSRFSECQIFGKYYPSESRLPQDGFFCNNANAALSKEVWRSHPFDEELTGLEDMHLCKKLVQLGHAVGYVADAPVLHLHDESWAQVRRRFEREAIALQHIMPEVHVTLPDFMRYFGSAVMLDLGAAIQRRQFRARFREICMYRLMQFWGAYRGNHFHRKLSRARKEKYYYPR